MRIRIPDVTANGTALIVGEEAIRRVEIIRHLEDRAESESFDPAILPTFEMPTLYTDRLGGQTERQMYTFTDRGGRSRILRPECANTLRAYARTIPDKDVRLYYVARCFRGEIPQRGRYREFTQFGVEWLNPTDSSDASRRVRGFADSLLRREGLPLTTDAKRDYSYYREGMGYEAIAADGLQVLGGGDYDNGTGFAIGVEQWMLVTI